MDGLISSVGLVVMLKPHMPAHGHCVVFLEIVMLLTVITADSPVADESVLDFTQHPMGFLEDLQSSTETPPSTSPTSHHTVFKSLDSLGALPSISEPSRETGIRHLHWGLVDSEISKSFTASVLLAEVAHPLSIPSLNPSRPVLTLIPHFKTTTKLPTDLKLAYSAQQPPSPSPKASRSRMQPPSNISISSLRPSLFITSTSPHLGLKSEWKTTFSIQQDGAKQIIAISASLSPNTAGHPELTFTDSSAVESHSNIPDLNPLRPSNAPLNERKPANDLNVLSNPDKFLTHGYYVPFTATFPTSPLSERTEVSIDEVYPTNTMEFDWGSGDYLETMSFFNINGEDYSLVTKLPTDSYDLEDYTEQYDTSFPSRVGISFSSLDPFHATSLLSLTTAYTTMVPLKSIYPSSVASTDTYTLDATPTANIDIPAASDIDWPDTYTIHPTDVLLPDMNSLEFYTNQLTKDNNSSDTEAEHRGNVTVVLINAADIKPTTSFTNDTKATEEESSNDPSGFEPHGESTTEESPRVNASEPLLYPSIVPTHFFESSSSTWGSNVYATEWSLPTLTVGIVSTAFAEARLPSDTPLLSDDAVSSSSLTDVHWFVTEPFSQIAIHTDPVLTTTMAFSPAPTQPTAYNSDETTPRNSNVTTLNPLNVSLVSTEPISNVTLVLPDMLGDQRVTVDGVDIPVTMTEIPTNDEDYGVPVVQTTTAATFTSHQATTRAITTEASTSINVIPNTSRMTTSTVTKSRQYLCKLDRPAYFIKLGFPSGTTVGYVKSQVRDILKAEFNKSVELQVVDPPPKFVFRVVSGPVVYTAISVINALRRSGHHFLSLSPNWTTPDRKYQIHTVLQFVPSNIDVRFCNFSERIESGLTMAFAEVLRRSKDSTNFTVHIVNVTKYQEQQLIRQPVDIIFTVHDLRGYLIGSEVSNALMKLTTVEFSYYMGFPVLQIAEPFHYPELNTSQLLRSSWIRTVLLGVLDHKVGERTFQANMERRVAILLREAIGLVGRVKRATIIENSSVQVVSASRLVGADYPLEIVYFVEGASGQRMPADEAVNLLNRMDVQRAAIILGYRVQGILAQPVEKVASSPTDAENTNVWIVIGVVIPLLVVIIIISILYWKLCRTDKLEFQPDAMTAIQQRQKSTGSLGVSRTSLLQTLPSIEQDIYDSEWEYVEEEEMYEDEEQEEEEEEVKRGELQASSVKGFDFAKLHLGQQSKDDVMVIQEAGLGPGPPSVSTKDGLSPSSNGEVPTPISKNSASSSKVSHSGRRRERISPSDGDSVVSDHSSERELAENLRAHATANDSKQPRKLPINVLNGIPPMNGTNEQLSSASIFEHVDRMSRATDTSRRLPNKVQLIAMQPIPGPPFSGKLSDTNQINKEIQVSLRHKSEIEHHRNKIRLRAKRKGHYDFPAMDDVTSGLADVKDQDCIYQKAQLQIDKILDPDAQVASIFMASKKSGRGRRSPKQKMKGQLNGGMMEADKDHLITEENDAAYRKCPGVNNVAYVSDPDQVQGSSHRSHYQTDDVFLGPGSSPPGQAPPPPPYIPPQPSIEEARLQMHSLLDDAFALVSPTSQGSTAGITLPGVNSNLPASSPPGQGPRPWGPPYPALSPFSDRFGDLGVSASSVQGMIPRHGLGTSYLPAGETAGQCERLQQDNLYSSKGLYTVEVPLSARPRPVGGTTGIQLHHLTQVGLSNRMNGYPAGVRAPPGNLGVGWNHYHDENFSRTEPEKDVMTRNSNREPTAAHVQLDTPAVGYLSAPPPLDTSPPTHSSASLIKAIREELLRLSQKQAAVSSYNS